MYRVGYIVCNFGCSLLVYLVSTHLSKIYCGIAEINQKTLPIFLVYLRVPPKPRRIRRAYRVRLLVTAASAAARVE
jgi:hypothetical protein